MLDQGLQYAIITHMNIIVGSKNPAKIAAVEDLIPEYPILKGAVVTGVDAQTTVSEQPLSIDETVDGAIQRAKNSFKDCTYSIGLESGLFPVAHTKSGYMDTCVCAIYDGNNIHLGLSSAFEYPTELTKLVLKGDTNISDAAKKIGLTHHEYIGHAHGVISHLTKGRIDREKNTQEAIRMALIHLENQELYT